MKENIWLKTSRSLFLISTFLIPFYIFRFSFGPIKTNLFEIIVVITLLFSLFSFLSNKCKPVIGSIWPYLFMLVALISVFISPDKVKALGIWKGWFLTPVTFYFLVINLFRKENIAKIYPWFYAAFALVVLWGFLQSWQVIGLLFYQKNDPSLSQYLSAGNFRIFGPFESPNYLAMFLVPMFFLSLLAVKNWFIKSRIFRLLALLPFGLALYDLWLTGSRAGIIAFVIGFLIIVTRNYGKGKKISKPLIASLIAIVVMCLAVFMVLSLNRSGSNASRIDIYRYSAKLIEQKPLLGVGLGSFQSEVAKVSANDSQFQNVTMPYALHPHNIFLAIWLNLGIIGLALFFIILYKFFSNCPDQTLEKSILLAAMMAILVHGLFDTTYFKNDLSAIFWIIIALKVTYEKV